MFAPADMLHLFADELAGLRGGRFALARIPSCSFDRFLFRHAKTRCNPCAKVFRNARSGGCRITLTFDV